MPKNAKNQPAVDNSHAALIADLRDQVTRDVDLYQARSQAGMTLALAHAATALEQPMSSQELAKLINTMGLCYLQGPIDPSLLRRIFGIPARPGDTDEIPGRTVIRVNVNASGTDPDMWLASKDACLCNAIEWLDAKAREKGANGTKVTVCKHQGAAILMGVPAEKRFAGFEEFLPVDLRREGGNSDFWFAYGSEWNSLCFKLFQRFGFVWSKADKRLVPGDGTKSLPQYKDFQAGDRWGIVFEGPEPKLLRLEPGIQAIPCIADGALSYKLVGEPTRKPVAVQPGQGLASRLAARTGPTAMIEAIVDHALRYNHGELIQSWIDSHTAADVERAKGLLQQRLAEAQVA